jgi:hypothetical protein
MRAMVSHPHRITRRCLLLVWMIFILALVWSTSGRPALSTLVRVLPDVVRLLVDIA